MSAVPNILDFKRGEYVILTVDLSGEHTSAEDYGKQVGTTYGISSPRVVCAVIGPERSEIYGIIASRRGSGSGGWEG